MILILLFIIFLLKSFVISPIPTENFDYQRNLIQIANTNICKPGYTLMNCKQTTPKITTTLDTISNTCQCANGDIVYNVNYVSG